MSSSKSQCTISTQELFGLPFCNEKGSDHLAMLYHGYIDDSADRNRERLVIAGAIIGKKDDWKPLGRRWNARLAEDDLEYFKSSHCETLNGQFHKFRTLGKEQGHARALRVRDDLDAIIQTSSVTALGVGLSVPFFKTMKQDPVKFGPIPDVPYRLAFQQLIAECGKAMMLLGREHIVTFGHDDGDDFPILHTLYKEFKKLNPKYRKVLGDFVPLDDKLHPPVQAADLVANIVLRSSTIELDTPTSENLKRLRSRMYKIVNWLHEPIPTKPSFTGEAPAKAVYAP